MTLSKTIFFVCCCSFTECHAEFPESYTTDLCLKCMLCFFVNSQNFVIFSVIKNKCSFTVFNTNHTVSL